MIETIITTLLWSMLAISIGAIIATVVTLIKNEITFRNHCIIATAIYEYNIHLIETDQLDQDNLFVTHMDMEDYDTTFYRFWDWGYTRILTPEKFELIKPYIKPWKVVKNHD